MAKDTTLAERIGKAADYVRKRTDLKPQVAVVLGSGLGDLSGITRDAVTIPFGKIPNFPTSSVQGHAGELMIGKIGRKTVAVMNGRVHYYEGYTMEEVAFPVRVLRALGAKKLVLTCAAGGMNPLYERGDIVAVVDHINLTGDNPLIGPNDDRLGPRFPDMSEPYDREYLKAVEDIALEERIRLRKGVFIGVAGPNLETAAEYRFLRMIGGDVVSMSMIAENIAAVHGGMRVAGFAVVTDMCLPDALREASHLEILKAAKSAAPKLTKLVARLIEKM
ncbi:MAG: purine-nucleoside phosphorylase [Candidatus Eisenbacteria bacterium]|nr:purine-nucleoside phosphorylase [Candidatus Eisenbacteria bacterium]